MILLQGNIKNHFDWLTQFRNLLVTVFKEGIRIKVSDFGLAHHISAGFQEYSLLDEEEHIPVRWTGMILISEIRDEHFSKAPEVLRTHKVSPKSDVWSFGISIYCF